MHCLNEKRTKGQTLVYKTLHNFFYVNKITLLKNNNKNVDIKHSAHDKFSRITSNS